MIKKYFFVSSLRKKWRRLYKALYDNNSGVAALEASLTFPVVLMLIFFILEMMKVNNTRSALDSIALEATLEFVTNKNTTNFDTIIEKYRPIHVPKASIKYYFAVYENLNKMCSVTPFGSEEVFWPASDTAYSTSQASYVDSDSDNTFLARDVTANSGYKELSNYAKPENDFGGNGKYSEELLIGKAFVLTFVCNYNFSSDFVKQFFVGGANTKDKSKFLIWGRGVGICN